LRDKLSDVLAGDDGDSIFTRDVLPGIAFGAWADALLFDLSEFRLQIEPGFFGENVHGRDHLKNIRLGYAVINIPAVPAVGHHLCISQNHQMLRDMRLAQPKVSFHVAHARLSVTQQAKDCQASGVAEKLEVLSLRFKPFEHVLLPTLTFDLLNIILAPLLAAVKPVRVVLCHAIQVTNIHLDALS
jgi:hypothetical protein